MVEASSTLTWEEELKERLTQYHKRCQEADAAVYEEWKESEARLAEDMKDEVKMAKFMEEFVNTFNASNTNNNEVLN